MKEGEVALFYPVVSLRDIYFFSRPEETYFLSNGLSNISPNYIEDPVKILSNKPCFLYKIIDSQNHKK